MLVTDTLRQSYSTVICQIVQVVLHTVEKLSLAAVVMYVMNGGESEAE